MLAHIRDSKLRGFGVRVLPSGAKRFVIHTQHRGQRTWKIVDDATTRRMASRPTVAPRSPDYRHTTNSGACIAPRIPNPGKAPEAGSTATCE